MTLAYVWIDHTADQNGTFTASTAGHRERDRDRSRQGAHHLPRVHGGATCSRTWLRRITDGWVILIGACLLGSYFVGSAIAG